MKTIFVDANVFVRFFTVDDRGQHEQSVELFRQAAAGKVVLVTGPPVLFEIAWTLRSAYQQTNPKVLHVIAAIAALPGLQLTDAESSRVLWRWPRQAASSSRTPISRQRRARSVRTRSQPSTASTSIGWASRSTRFDPSGSHDVEWRRDDPGDGYVPAAGHNIQPDVPPEKILAMADATRRFGSYPLSA